MAPPQTFGKCFFLEWIDVVTWFECVSRPGKCAWICVSVHKRRVTRRWAEKVAKMCRNWGNAIDVKREKFLLLPPPHWIWSGKRDHGKFLLLPPPPHWIRYPVNEITDIFCYYPPPHWMRAAPRRDDGKCTGWPPPKKNPGYAVERLFFLCGLIRQKFIILERLEMLI